MALRVVFLLVETRCSLSMIYWSVLVNEYFSTQTDRRIAVFQALPSSTKVPSIRHATNPFKANLGVPLPHSPSTLNPRTPLTGSSLFPSSHHMTAPPLPVFRRLVPNICHFTVCRDVHIPGPVLPTDPPPSYTRVSSIPGSRVLDSLTFRSIQQCRPHHCPTKFSLQLDEHHFMTTDSSGLSVLCPTALILCVISASVPPPPHPLLWTTDPKYLNHPSTCFFNWLIAMENLSYLSLIPPPLLEGQILGFLPAVLIPLPSRASWRISRWVSRSAWDSSPTSCHQQAIRTQGLMNRLLLLASFNCM